MPGESDFTNTITLPDNGSHVMRTYTQTYKYDELGNLLQMKSQNVWTRDYVYNFGQNNHLLGHDLESSLNNYEYDNHGNMTKMPHLQELKYDYANQLHAVTLDASGNKAYYVYDSGGNRVRKVVEKGNIVEERFYMDNYEYFTKTNNGTIEEERETVKVTDDKQVIALIDNDIQSSLFTIRYQLTNHLDSASLELDHEANIISYEEYHPFGTTSYRSGRNEAEVSMKRYKYVFKELDNETGLYYYGMRYYAPWIARFISVDPLQFKYPYYTPVQYAGNKPISYIDLDGAEEDTIPLNKTPKHYRLNYSLDDELYSIDVINGEVETIPGKLRQATQAQESIQKGVTNIPSEGELVKVYCKTCLNINGSQGAYQTLRVGTNEVDEIQTLTLDVLVGETGGRSAISEIKPINIERPYAQPNRSNFATSGQSLIYNGAIDDLNIRLSYMRSEPVSRDGLKKTAIGFQIVYSGTKRTDMKRINTVISSEIGLPSRPERSATTEELKIMKPNDWYVILWQHHYRPGTPGTDAIPATPVYETRTWNRLVKRKPIEIIER